jgi:OOP family OmpA-OmpF porin
MRSTHTLGLLVLAGLGPLAAGAALAEDEGYLYGGLSVGASRAKIDQDRIAASLLGAGLTATGFQRDERGSAYRLFGGYQFNHNIALEAGYFDLGQFGFNTGTTPAGTLNGQIRLRGLNLDLVGALPLGDRWSLLGRVGAQAAQTRDRFTSSGAVAVLNPSPSQREINYKVGAGLQYAFSRSFLMRLEAEHDRVNDAVGNHGGVNVASLSLVFPFGRPAEAAPRYVSTPAYVAPAPEPVPAPLPVTVAPAPPPVVVAQAAPPAAVVAAPVRRRVSFSAESLFGFDQSTVKAEGKAALDKFAAETRGAQFDVISVEGHTDRLGSTAYNQALSLRRAEAVKAYLVASGGFAADQVKAGGKGETSPVTQTADCKGSKPTAQLITCLQPDRRVDIEVTGSR